MPNALKNAILLRADLPDNFYITAIPRIEFLITNISNSADEILETLYETHCNAEYLENFSHTSFIFNLLLHILFNMNEKFEVEQKTNLINNFLTVADAYLTSYYNPEILNNKNEISCIPPLHLFSWYLVKASKQKKDEPLEYIKTLRTLLKRIPQAKSLVEFLIEEFQKENEEKKQEQIKNASPELIAMAEQLKTMLSVYPPNSPELLAIKQNPMYKQVAFLIEN